MDQTHYMREALEEAHKAASAGEVPVGAVVVVGGKIIARAHNEIEQRKDSTAHAEILAIKQASSKIGDWRLEQASLFVTLEPCTMCIGAMVLARVENLYFGAYDKRQGAVGSLFDLSHNCGLPHSLSVFPEVLADECKEVLGEFFSEKR